jgi:hypothetical protein
MADMKNVVMRIEGNKLIMEVDLTKDFGPSSTGKSLTVATSSGNVSVPGKDGFKVGLNVYKKPPA